MDSYIKVLYENGVAREIVHIAPDAGVEAPWVKMTLAEFRAQTGGGAAKKRAELAKLIRERAGELEQAGITVNGGKVDTTRESQAMLSGAVNYVTLNPEAVIDWQGPDGTFTQLGKDQILGLALLVGQHVQAHFTRRKELMEQLAQTPDSELNDFRDTIEQFWEE